MFTNFTEEARKVLSLAKKECMELKHPYIGSEHILLAILKNRNDVIENFKNFVKKDRSKVQIEQFTTLNLMELTRKHVNSKNN